MKRLPGFRYDAKAQLAHFEIVLPGAVVSKSRQAEAREEASDH